MQCPFCGSTHLQSYQVIRAQGTTHVQAEHGGINGPYVVRSQGVAYTELARHCAPPAPPSPMGFVIATLLGGFVAYQGLQGFGFVYWPFVFIGLGLVGIGWLLFAGYKIAANDYREAKHRWFRSYLCASCGQSCLAS